VTGMLRHGRYDLVVIGGGITGLTAAWHAAGRGLSVLVFEGAPQFGGQIATVARVEGVPPGNAISGPDFSATLYTAARDAGTRFSPDTVEAIVQDSAGLTVRYADGFALARAVLLATGGTARRLGIAGETALEGRGVSHCAACDGPLCRGRDVMVIGGGDAALQEALVLADFANTVTVVVRGQARARRGYLERAETRPNLRFMWEWQVAELCGDNGLETVRLRNANGDETEMACFSIFPKIGADPNSGLAHGLCSLAPDGSIITNSMFETDLRGLFAAGAVRSGYGGDAVMAASEGASAASVIAARLRPTHNRRGEMS